MSSQHSVVCKLRSPKTLSTLEHVGQNLKSLRYGRGYAAASLEYGYGHSEAVVTS